MADAALDGRVFALSLERLAPVQAHLWGWGGSLGMATTDYFIVPEVLWTGVQCTATFQRRTDLKTIAGRGGLVLPQDLFHEQVRTCVTTMCIVYVSFDSMPTAWVDCITRSGCINTRALCSSSLPRRRS